MSALKFRAAMSDIKFTSNASWWIKNPLKATQQRQQRKQNFCYDMAELFSNISLHGYNKLLDPVLSLWEKLIWLALHVTTFVALTMVMSLVWEEFVAQYFNINLHDPLYPVENVPFPAISICSNNRISLQAAQLYARELSEKDPKKQNVSYFLQGVAYFSRLYYKYEEELNDFDDFFIVQQFLDTFGTFDNETFYNTRRNMRMLTPACRNFILECKLAGTEVACFTDKTFKESLTVYGPCCTFNMENSYRQRSFKNRFVDADFGLTVVLNGSRNDDFTPVLNINGYIVIVHDPSDFPDIASGAAVEVFPSHATESFLSFRARIIDTDEDLRSFSPKTRKCYFDDEAPTPDLMVKNGYSFTNCITHCRIKSIMALCRCLPFYMPLNLVENSDGVIYCTLQHVPCLVRYNYKWRSVLTQRVNIPGLEREMEEALYCPQCMPSCNDIQYRVFLMSLPISRYKVTPHADLLRMSLLGSENVSLLHVHFQDAVAQYYRRVAGNAWYESLSTVGNLVSIFIGFSIVAVFEIWFYVLKYMIVAVKMFVTHNTKNPAGNDAKDTMDGTKLHICP